MNYSFIFTALAAIFLVSSCNKSKDLPPQDANTATDFSRDITPLLEVTGKNSTKIYENVQIVSVSAQGVKFSHSAGVSLLPFEVLPEEWLAKNITMSPEISAASKRAPSALDPTKDASRLVIIKTDNGGGSGFIAQVEGKTYVYTNAHVICGLRGNFSNKVASIRTVAGRSIPPPQEIELSTTYDPNSPNGLENVARFPVTLKEGETAYALAEIAPSCSINQKVVTYGGNDGGGAGVTAMNGKVAALGGDRTEILCDTDLGSSGGPVILTGSKQLLGISTYLYVGKRDLWARDNYFEKSRIFAVRPDKVTNWRKIVYTALVNALAGLNAFDQDTLSLDAACNLTPKPNRGGFSVQGLPNGSYTFGQVVVDRSHVLGAALCNGITRVNQRLGGTNSKISAAGAAPVYAEFFAFVAQASSTQMSSLSPAAWPPYLKPFIAELLEARKAVHSKFISGSSRFR